MNADKIKKILSRRYTRIHPDKVDAKPNGY
jgi:hypothetical protein